METRNGPSQAARVVFLFLTAALAAGRTASPAGPPSFKLRTISVRALADTALLRNSGWKTELLRAVSDISLKLEAAAGVRLEIEGYGYWNSDPDKPRVASQRRAPAVIEALVHLDRLVRDGSRRDSELVIGLIPDVPEELAPAGVADYFMGTVVIKNLRSKRGIPFVLLHEVFHVFGAIDLNTPGSVMSVQDPGFRIDGFTRSILQANRERSFIGGRFPLSAQRILEAIALYESRRDLGLGEDELVVCLGELRRALNRGRDPGTI